LTEAVEVGDYADADDTFEDANDFEPKNPQSLFSSIQKIWGNTLKLKELQNGARLSFEEKYSPKMNYETLIGIYNSAINNNLKKIKKS
jgi:hypothetical protein